MKSSGLGGRVVSRSINPKINQSDVFKGHGGKCIVCGDYGASCPCDPMDKQAENVRRRAEWRAMLLEKSEAS